MMEHEANSHSLVCFISLTVAALLGFLFLDFYLANFRAPSSGFLI
jgi:hypothetical protein